MELVIDTREQLSYAEYFKHKDVQYIFKKLEVGDYSIVGYENQFAIERKSLQDFIQSVTWDRARFVRELQRAKNYKFFAIVVEGSFYDFMNHHYRSEATPMSLISTLLMWTVKYNVPILLADSRTGGALSVTKMAEAYLKYVIYWEGKEK